MRHSSTTSDQLNCPRQFRSAARVHECPSLDGLVNSCRRSRARYQSAVRRSTGKWPPRKGCGPYQASLPESSGVHARLQSAQGVAPGSTLARFGSKNVQASQYDNTEKFRPKLLGPVCGAAMMRGSVLRESRGEAAQDDNNKTTKTTTEKTNFEWIGMQVARPARDAERRQVHSAAEFLPQEHRI